MGYEDMFNGRAIATAIGLVALLGVGSASADNINWGTPTTLFEDDDLDFLIQANGETDGILREGDTLVSILEFNDANGVPIGPSELTGISVIEILGFADLDGVGGANDIVFGPASGGFNAVTGLNVVDGGAGEGAMVSFWLDPADDLQIDAGSVIAGNESCQDLSTCIAQASNGDAWLTVGLGGDDPDADDFWLGLNAVSDTNIVFLGDPSQVFGSFSTGLSILDNQTGVQLIEDSIPCGVFCGADNGQVDWLANGSVKGGGFGGQNGGEWFATSDFDVTTLRAPEPATALLVVSGLLGIALQGRRRWA